MLVNSLTTVKGRGRTACTVASCEELFRVGLSGVSSATEGLSHCQVNLEVFAVYMSEKVLAKVSSISEGNAQHTLCVRPRREPLLCRG
jgi:hypothetical protein